MSDETEKRLPEVTPTVTTLEFEGGYFKCENNIFDFRFGGYARQGNFNNFKDSDTLIEVLEYEAIGFPIKALSDCLETHDRFHDIQYYERRPQCLKQKK